jgi:putative hydrolase of the HAD superfamily
MIKTIVFDFGNVIGFFDNQVFLARVRPHTELSAAALRAAFAENLEDSYESGKLSTPVFLQRVCALGKLRCSEEFVARAWADIFRPNPEVCALIPRLKPRYRLLLGSNTNDLHSRQFRRQFGETLQHFDALVLSHEVGVRKPAAGFFRHCRKLAECAPNQCLFIDDLPANVEGALALGWRGIVYRDFGDLRSQLEALGIMSD